MPSDPRLDAILRALLQPWQPTTTAADTSRLYASAAAVLTTLTNPLNVTLLTTQILTAPAIWSSPDALRASLRVFGTFQSATLGKMELEVQGKAGTIGVQEWINVVVRGANQNVPRWKHALLLGGVLSAVKDGKGGTVGGGGGNAFLIPRATRKSLEEAFCRAVNLSVGGSWGKGKDVESDVLCLVLSYSIQSLSDRAKKLIDYDALLPVVVRSIYYSAEGFQSGYFLSKIDNDVVKHDGKLAWPSKSNSLLELQQRLARPLFTSMSSVARLAGSALRESRDLRTIHTFLDRLADFAHTLTAQWKRNRLSQISQIDEAVMIDAQSRRTTIPVVWQLLKLSLFTTTLILQELATRLIQDAVLASPPIATALVSKILHILRGLYFITARLGPQAFTSYNFVSSTAIDVLAAHPTEAEKFLQSIAPDQVGIIPTAHLSRTTDLFFLNTAETLVPALSANITTNLLIPAAAPYLTPPQPLDPNLRASFESAHSLMLAIIANTKAPLAAQTALPIYIDVVLAAFPENGLSRRQFRIAFATLVKMCEAPGSPLDGETVLKRAYECAKKASEERMVGPDEMEIRAEEARQKAIAAAAAAAAGIPPPAVTSESAAGNTPPQSSAGPPAQQAASTAVATVPSRPGTASAALQQPQQLTITPPPAFSEKESMILSLIDSLPHTRTRTLERWLPRVAALIAGIQTPAAQTRLRARLWEMISGELDVERAEVGVRWWSEGGRRVFGWEEEEDDEEQQQQQQQHAEEKDENKEGEEHKEKRKRKGKGKAIENGGLGGEMVVAKL